MGGHIRADLEVTPSVPPRVAGISGLVFAACYTGHLVLQGAGPPDGSIAAVAGYFTEHRTALLVSEVVNGGGLVVFVLFAAAVATSVRHVADHLMAAAVLASGVLFVAMGLIPVVFAVTAFAAATSLAVLRTGLLPRWLGYTGLGAAVLFLIGAALSIVGSAEGESLPVGPAIFLAWILGLCIGLLRGTE